MNFKMSLVFGLSLVCCDDSWTRGSLPSQDCVKPDNHMIQHDLTIIKRASCTAMEAKTPVQKSLVCLFD